MKLNAACSSSSSSESGKSSAQTKPVQGFECPFTNAAVEKGYAIVQLHASSYPWTSHLILQLAYKHDETQREQFDTCEYNDVKKR